jgi:hypothetical protein
MDYELEKALAIKWLKLDPNILNLANITDYYIWRKDPYLIITIKGAVINAVARHLVGKKSFIEFRYDKDSNGIEFHFSVLEHNGQWLDYVNAIDEENDDIL